jgi:outer membrane protein TolC
MAARAAYVRVDRQARLEIESSYADWQQTRHALQMFAQPVVDARAQIVRATQQQLTEGVASVLDVILAQRELLAAQKVRAQVIRDAQLARWQLAVAIDTW